MRTIEDTSRFKRDDRGEKSGVLGKKIEALLTETVFRLSADEVLPARYLDHALVKDWSIIALATFVPTSC